MVLVLGSGLRSNCESPDWPTVVTRPVVIQAREPQNSYPRDRLFVFLFLFPLARPRCLIVCVCVVCVYVACIEHNASLARILRLRQRSGEPPLRFRSRTCWSTVLRTSGSCGLRACVFPPVAACCSHNSIFEECPRDLWCPGRGGACPLTC